MSEAVLELKGDDKKPAVALVEDAGNAGPTPEEALAQSAERIKALETEAANARRAAETHRTEAQQARASQQQDQAAVLGAAVEAANADVERFQAEYQAALESGDFAKTAQINTKLNGAINRQQRAQGDLEMLKAGNGRAIPQNQGQSNNGITPATQQWIDSHPEFSAKGHVKDALILYHNQLLRDGLVAESPAYFRALDAEYDRITGNRQEPPMSQNNRQFDGAPPSRGGGTQGGRTVRTLLGPVGVTQRNGQTLISIPESVRADFEEGARVTQMSLADYALEQVRAAQEREQGGTGGLITTEGATYR